MNENLMTYLKGSALALLWNTFTILYLPTDIPGRVSLNPFAVILTEKIELHTVSGDPTTYRPNTSTIKLVSLAKPFYIFAYISICKIVWGSLTGISHNKFYMRASEPPKNVVILCRLYCTKIAAVCTRFEKVIWSSSILYNKLLWF